MHHFHFTLLSITTLKSACNVTAVGMGKKYLRHFIAIKDFNITNLHAKSKIYSRISSVIMPAE